MPSVVALLGGTRGAISKSESSGVAASVRTPRFDSVRARRCPPRSRVSRNHVRSARLICALLADAHADPCKAIRPRCGVS